MARDIEEFLRKAAERRNKRKSETNTDSVSGNLPPDQHSESSDSEWQLTRAPSDFSEVDRNEIEVVQPETVTRHVQRHLDTSDIARKAGRLGAEVGLADDKLEARLHQSFDHEVGTLSQERRVLPGLESQPLPPPLWEWLRNPKSIRQAIVVSEILRRPDF